MSRTVIMIMIEWYHSFLHQKEWPWIMLVIPGICLKNVWHNGHREMKGSSCELLVTAR